MCRWENLSRQGWYVNIDVGWVYRHKNKEIKVFSVIGKSLKAFWYIIDLIFYDSDNSAMYTCHLEENRKVQRSKNSKKIRYDGWAIQVTGMDNMEKEAVWYGNSIIKKENKDVIRRYPEGVYNNEINSNCIRISLGDIDTSVNKIVLGETA